MLSPSIILINVLFISAGGIKITDECGNISCVVSEAGVIIKNMLYYAVNKVIKNGRVLYRVFRKRMEIIYFPLTGLKLSWFLTLRKKRRLELIASGFGIQLNVVTNIINRCIIPLISNLHDPFPLSY